MPGARNGGVRRPGRVGGDVTVAGQSRAGSAAVQGVLELQRLAGNAAVAHVVGSERRLMRAPSKRTPPGGRRVIYIDADVLGQINRGNEAAATRLRELTKTQTVRMSAYNYKEAVGQGRDLMHRKANELLVEDLGIHVDPPLTQAERVDRSIGAFHGKPARGAETVIQMKDIPTVAGVPKDAELWTFDRTIRKEPRRVEKAFGTRIAEETTTIAPVAGEVDYGEGRRLLQLDPVVIDEDGKLVRRGRQGMVVKANVKTSVPSGTIVKGEFDAKSPGKGSGGGSPPKGGGGTAATTDVSAGGGSKADEAVLKSEGELMKTEGKLVRTAARVGAIAEALLPGPLDALMLMVEYAGAYADAQDAIRRRNFRAGFRLGLAAALVGLESGWLRENLARKYVEEDRVISEVVGATGLAEKEFNKGLGAGHPIGAVFSQDQKNALTQAGFAALAAEGYRVSRDTDLFTIDTVARLARVLQPQVEQVFAELETFVYPIGESTHRALTAVMQDVPHVSTTHVKIRAAWINISPGVKKLALITDTTISHDSTVLTDDQKREWIPDRMIAVALKRTERAYGKIDTIDGPMMRYYPPQAGH